MENTKQRTNMDIPLWFRSIAAIFFIGISGLFGLAVAMPARSYFGLAYETIVFTLLSGIFVFGVFDVALVFFPQRLFARAVYWLFYKLRKYIFFLALYGLIEYALRLPLFYFVYIQPHINFAVILSIRGLIPLVGLGVVIASGLFASPIPNPFPPGWQEKFTAIKNSFFEKITPGDEKWTGILPAILPVFIVLVVVYGVWGAKLSNYLPIFWNDATGYWLWIRQFSHYGFNSGYNFANELMPAAEFNRFGEGSPVYVYFYGAIGRLVGWSPQLPILINFGLITASVYAFSRMLRLDTSQNLVLALVLSFSWPVLLFSATTSHESLNQAIAIGMAGIFLFLLQEKQGGIPLKILVLIFVFFAGLVRLSWVILFFPLFFHYFRGNLFRRALLSGLVGGGLALGIILVTRYLVPPINNSIFATLGGNLPQIFTAISDQFLTQFRDLIRPGKLTPGMASVFIVLVLLGYSLKDLIKGLKQTQPHESLLKSQAFFDFYNVATLLIAGMSLYLTDGFYRVFFPPLMVSIFMQIAKRDYRFVKVMLVFHLIFAPVILNDRNNLEGTKINYTYQMPELADSQEEIKKLVTFDEKTTNPWCNTILIPLGFYDGRLTTLDPGIGISYILFHPLKTIPLQSNYLLLDQEIYTELQEKYNLKAVQLASLPIGDLYRNLDSDCEQ